MRMPVHRLCSLLEMLCQEPDAADEAETDVATCRATWGKRKRKSRSKQDSGGKPEEAITNDHEQGEEADAEEDAPAEFDVPEHAEVEDSAVDPRQQAGLRQQLRSEIMPRGRGAAAGKCKPKAKSKSKASPKAKAKGRAAKPAATGNTSRAASTKAPAKATTKAKAKARKPPSAGSNDEKKNDGPRKRGKVAKARVPPVTPEGVVLSLGCASCRFAPTGCPTCEKASFKGKRRADVSQEVIDRAQLSLPYKKRKLAADV